MFLTQVILAVSQLVPCICVVSLVSSLDWSQCSRSVSVLCAEPGSFSSHSKAWAKCDLLNPHSQHSSLFYFSLILLSCCYFSLLQVLWTSSYLSVFVPDTLWFVPHYLQVFESFINVSPPSSQSQHFLRSLPCLFSLWHLWSLYVLLFYTLSLFSSLLSYHKLNSMRVGIFVCFSHYCIH